MPRREAPIELTDTFEVFDREGRLYRIELLPERGPIGRSKYPLRDLGPTVEIAAEDGPSRRYYVETLRSSQYGPAHSAHRSPGLLISSTASGDYGLDGCAMMQVMRWLDRVAPER